MIIQRVRRCICSVLKAQAVAVEGSIRKGVHIHIFVFIFLENNTFQKNSIMHAEHEYMNMGPRDYRTFYASGHNGFCE